MLDQLRGEALECISASERCVISTAGPAGLQAAVVPCILNNSRIYVLIPSTTDLIFNLEYAEDVVLTTPEWQLYGIALILDALSQRHRTVPPTLHQRAIAECALIAEVFPLRMHLTPDQQRDRTTIDFTLPHNDTETCSAS